MDLCAFDKFLILYLDSKFPSPTKSSLLHAEQSQVSPSPCIPSLSVTGEALFLFIMSMPCTGQPRACAPALHVCNTPAVQRHLWCSTYSSDLDRDWTVKQHQQLKNSPLELAFQACGKQRLVIKHYRNVRWNVLLKRKKNVIGSSACYSSVMIPH